MKLFTKSMEPNTTLGVAERVAYMSGNIGIALINTIVATFLMFFYTDVMMLNAGIIGTILMVSRLFDGVTDIIMGMIVDRTHSKYGKARVWVIRTCIPYAISGLLLVCVPGGMTELVQYIYVFITYNICNSVFLTALYVPYNAMTCNITSNPYERGVLGIFVLFGATFGTKERCGSTSEKVKIHAKEEMRSLFTNKYWILAIMTILFVMFFTAFTGGAGLYFAKGVLGDTAYYAQFANFMSVTQMISLFIAFVPMKKCGKRNTLMIGLTIMAIGTGIQCIWGNNLTMLIVCSVLKGLGGGFAAGVGYGLVADTIDYGEWKTGTKAEGVGMATMTFVTKVSAGFAGAIIGWINEMGGYEAAVAVQNAKAVFGLKVSFSYLPFIFCALGFVLMIFYDLDKIFPQIQADLEKRRENKNK